MLLFFFVPAYNIFKNNLVGIISQNTNKQQSY